MKALLLALALFGDAPIWEGSFIAGLTCPTLRDANVVANVAQSYSLASTVETRTRCLFMAFTGTKTGETEVFGIGDTLYRFQLVTSDGWTFYVLEEVGKGYVT